LNARSIALISTFAALAIALNTIRIPTIYWPGMFYTLCDIPVLIAFIIFGVKIGLLVEAVHIAGQEIFFPVGPPGIVVYPMGFFTLLLMFSGIYLASKLITRRAASGKQFSEKRRTIYSTGIATALRGGLMPIIDYAVLYNVLLPLVISISSRETYIAYVARAINEPTVSPEIASALWGRQKKKTDIDVLSSKTNNLLVLECKEIKSSDLNRHQKRLFKKYLVEHFYKTDWIRKNFQKFKGYIDAERLKELAIKNEQPIILFPILVTNKLVSIEGLSMTPVITYKELEKIAGALEFKAEKDRDSGILVFEIVDRKIMLPWLTVPSRV
jgi:riboflavin transporter FmnP